MKKKTLAITAITLITIAAAVLMQDKSRPAITNSDVAILPTLESKLSDTKSSVWCATLQLAWDEANALLKNKITMKSQAPEVDILNNNPYPKGCIDPKLFYAGAGFVQDGFYEKMMKGLEVKFGQQNFAQNFPAPKSDIELLSCAYLKASLPFERKFKTLQSARKFKGSAGETAVTWFGFKPQDDEDYQFSGELLNWSDEDNFTLSLFSKLKDERIILAKMPKPKCVKDVINSVIKEKDSAKNLVDYPTKTTLMIPEITLKETHDFKDIITTADIEVKQLIEFKLDATGAKIESFSLQTMPKSFPKERNYIFDKPFMVLLWRKNAPLPYLAVWVNGGEVLTKRHTD